MEVAVLESSDSRIELSEAGGIDPFVKRGGLVLVLQQHEALSSYCRNFHA